MMRRFLRLKGVCLIFLVCSTLPVQAAPLRIMAIGDSDVSGFGIYLSFRYDLWLQLNDAGFDVDFVGRNFNAVFDPALYPRVSEFDRHHEGIPAAVLSEIAAVAPAAVRENQPDVVLIQASYDICQFGVDAVANAGGLFSFLINVMRDEDPSLHFVLGLNSPWVQASCGVNIPDHIPAWNQEITEVAEILDSPQSRVLLSDNFTGFNLNTMFDTTNLHNNREGEMFVAGRWFEVLEDFLPTIQDDSNSFSINAGLNDAWFNPETLGQGFFVTVFPDIEMMFLAWFTYDTERPPAEAMANLGEPGHRWLTAFGPYDGNTATLDIELTSGGVFDAANPATSSVPDGTIVVEFDDCTTATVSYDILSANLAGEIPIQRIAADNVPICEALAE